jgi:hypothetical protein
MGACNSTNYATPVYKRVYVYGAGETCVDGIYRICGKTKWRNGFPAYRNSSGYYLSYETVGTSNTANGWIIGKLPTAFYGVKSDLSCPPQNGWETFAGLEPHPEIVFTKFDAEKLRAKLFRNRIIKKPTNNSFEQNSEIQNSTMDALSTDLTNVNLEKQQDQQPHTSRSQFTTDRSFNSPPTNNGWNKQQHRQQQNKHIYGYKSFKKQTNVLHSPFKKADNNNNINKENNSEIYNPAFYNSPIKNPIHYSENNQSQQNTLDERIIETSYARKERERIQARIDDAKQEAERFKKEQEAYLASINNNVNTSMNNFR